MKKNNKKAQEEMVGFALIIIILAVVILVFLGFALKNTNKTTTQNYEVESFLQAVLQYTTDCQDYTGYLSLQKVISECDRDITCLDGRNSCEVLNSTLNKLIEESWQTGEDRPVKGHILNISSSGEQMLFMSSGNITRNSRIAIQSFTRSGTAIDLKFDVYY